LGAIADRGRLKKPLLAVFTYLGVFMSAGLYFIEQGQWEWAVLVYVLGSLGFAGGNIFYDAMLADLVPDDQLDRISSFGYALGYLGGGLLFLINVLMTLQPDWFGLAGPAEAVRLSFLNSSRVVGCIQRFHPTLGSRSQPRDPYEGEFNSCWISTTC
jgi:UMF1 family MFS transporter